MCLKITSDSRRKHPWQTNVMKTTSWQKRVMKRDCNELENLNANVISKASVMKLTKPWVIKTSNMIPKNDLILFTNSHTKLWWRRQFSSCLETSSIRVTYCSSIIFKFRKRNILIAVQIRMPNQTIILNENIPEILPKATTDVTRMEVGWILLTAK